MLHWSADHEGAGFMDAPLMGPANMSRGIYTHAGIYCNRYIFIVRPASFPVRRQRIDAVAALERFRRVEIRPSNVGRKLFSERTSFHSMEASPNNPRLPSMLLLQWAASITPVLVSVRSTYDPLLCCNTPNPSSRLFTRDLDR